MAWLDECGKSYGDPLTLGDLMDLGFDPTRLKEMTVDGEEFISERVETRKLAEIEKRNKLLERIASEMAESKISSASLRTNPALLIIQDRGNAYVLRRKIEAIHLDEAIEQIQTNRQLKSLNATIQIDSLLLSTAQAAIEAIEGRLGLPGAKLYDRLTTFVSWDLKNNRPKLVIDFEGTYLESVWMA